MSAKSLIVFGIAIWSCSSAKFCSRSYVDGKWISEGDCGGPGMMSEIMKELQVRAADEESMPIENPIEKPTAKPAGKPIEKPIGKPIENPIEKPTAKPAGKPTENATVFQRRIKGDVDFYRNWTEYMKGFGNHDGDFWLGLEKLHELTKDGNMELVINMTAKHDGARSVAKYSHFRIGPGSDNYTLHAYGLSGNASTYDGFYDNSDEQFSTYDADHDGSSTGNCASLWEGGWWYYACGQSNLNGNFNKTGKKGIFWDVPLRFSEMKIRRKL